MPRNSSLPNTKYPPVCVYFIFNDFFKNNFSDENN